jgi:hypothetical protein
MILYYIYLRNKKYNLFDSVFHMNIRWFIFIFFQLFLAYNLDCQTNESLKKNSKSSNEKTITSNTNESSGTDFVYVNPNPFNDFLSIELYEEAEDFIHIEILSVVGKTVREFSLPSQNHYSLNLSYLDTGIYFLKINNGKSSCVKRIIHQ